MKCLSVVRSAWDKLDANIVMDRTGLIAIVKGPFRQPAWLDRCAGMEDRFQDGYTPHDGLARLAAGIGMYAIALDKLVDAMLAQECDRVRDAGRQLPVE